MGLRALGHDGKPPGPLLPPSLLDGGIGGGVVEHDGVGVTPEMQTTCNGERLVN